MAACAFRAHLAEYGVIVPQGRHRVDALVAKLDEIREDLPEDACFALDALVGQLDALKQQIDGIDIRLAEIHKTNSICRLLATIPGIGPITATAFAATSLTVSVRRVLYCKLFLVNFAGRVTNVRFGEAAPQHRSCAERSHWAVLVAWSMWALQREPNWS
jgi:hypothetical protein